jgi:hypothetical protein
MEKIIVFFLTALLLLSTGPVFPGPGSNDGAEAFLPGDGSTICLSFEHYKMQDGWTPVVLSMGELNCLLWMDEDGRVSELREPGAHFVEPVCFIDVSAQSLRKETDALYFDVYEQNSVRTRWRLSPGGTAGTVAKKIFPREGGIDLCLGSLRLPLHHVTWDFKEFSPGLFQVQFHGPIVKGRQRLVYEKAAGMIYSTYEWNNRFISEQSLTWATKPGKPAAGGIPPQERAALIALYNSTNGDNWTDNSGWKTPPLDVDGFALPGTENTWCGITCDAGNTTVQSIQLLNNNLNGAVPPELGNLANLQYLYFYDNKLSGSIPPEIGNLANLKWLGLGWNQLSGSIPPELGNLANLQGLVLYWDQFSGNIPKELGNLANLQRLELCLNQLSGSIPSNLINLTNLLNDCADLRWNALYTNDDILRAFLDSKQGGNWEVTQTIAPEDVIATSLSTSSIEINWTPISYTSDTGGYRVFYSTTHWGPYTYFGMTANKSSSSLTVTSLNPGATYYFVVQTRTYPHENNLNTVDSEYSTEVSASTLQTITIAGTVTSGGIGLPGVTITLSNGGGTATTAANGNYSVTVNYGWTGSVTPSKAGYNFSPPNRSYTNVTVNQTNQDFMGNLVTRLILTSPNGGESWGLRTIRNITWTSSRLSGKIRLELWKANKRFSVIAANIPIVNGSYAWTVGNYTPEPISAGNDYRVKVVTANGLYNDTSDGSFSIVNPSIKLTSPRGGENWKLGTQQNITWTSVGLTGNVKLLLLKGGAQVGIIARGISLANGTYAWTAGRHSNGMTSAGCEIMVPVKNVTKISILFNPNGDSRPTHPASSIYTMDEVPLLRDNGGGPKGRGVSVSVSKCCF